MGCGASSSDGSGYASASKSSASKQAEVHHSRQLAPVLSSTAAHCFCCCPIFLPPRGSFPRRCARAAGVQREAAAAAVPAGWDMGAAVDSGRSQVLEESPTIWVGNIPAAFGSISELGLVRRTNGNSRPNGTHASRTSGMPRVRVRVLTAATCCTPTGRGTAAHAEGDLRRLSGVRRSC